MADILDQASLTDYLPPTKIPEEPDYWDFSTGCITTISAGRTRY
jgi:hypothetical protein